MSCQHKLLSFIKQSTNNIESFMIAYCLLQENSTELRNTYCIVDDIAALFTQCFTTRDTSANERA